jgi:hypothetical protein
MGVNVVLGLDLNRCWRYGYRGTLACWLVCMVLLLVCLFVCLFVCLLVCCVVGELEELIFCCVMVCFHYIYIQENDIY